jgi:hypothetical protein
MEIGCEGDRLELGGIELLPWIRNMKDKTVGGHKGGQAVDEQSSVEIDVIVEHLGLEENRDTGGASKGIENSNLLRKHRRIVGRHV